MITKEEMKLRREKVIKCWNENKDLNLTIKDMAKMCNVNRNTFSRYLKEYGITPHKHYYKHQCNRSFFKSIDTEEKAYWLGFIYADGNVFIKENQYYNLSIAIQHKDIDHLYKFAKSINTTVQPYLKWSKSNKGEFLMCRLDISSKEICQDLINLGCTPCKSLTKTFPTLDENLLHHFLRGYFDGNGSIYITKTNDICLTIASSLSFLEGLQEYFIDIFNVRPKKIYRTNEKTWGTLKWVNQEALLLITYLYAGSKVHLDRKKRIVSTINRAKSVNPKSLDMGIPR